MRRRLLDILMKRQGINYSGEYAIWFKRVKMGSEVGFFAGKKEAFNTIGISDT